MSSTKIELLPPFKEVWKSGYIVVNSENRRNAVLYNSNKDRSTVSYARYLMSVYLGRFLASSEHVDHINEDKTDDRIENLQILSCGENSAKNVKFRTGGRLKAYIKCPSCHICFSRNASNTQIYKCKFGAITFCTKTCSDLFKKIRLCFDKELLDFISTEQILYQYK